MTVEELKQFITTTDDDRVLEARLLALESFIRKYTNNNFMIRGLVYNVEIIDNFIYCNARLLKVGDTITLSDSDVNDGFFVITEVNDDGVIVDSLLSDSKATMTITKYPMDVKMGIVNIIKWENQFRNKIGISSESISRHSVSYTGLGDAVGGYPSSIMSFLKPYKRARF